MTEPVGTNASRRPGLFSRLLGKKDTSENAPGIPDVDIRELMPAANVPLTDEDRAALQRDIDRPLDQVSIAVSSKKGGIGKSTSILALGTALAMYRRDIPAAIDANPDRGTLAERLGEEHAYTVGDLLEHSEDVGNVADVLRYMNVATSRLAVVASEKDAQKQRAFNPEDYAEVRAMILHFFKVMLTDTGTDLTLPLIDAVHDATDILVVPATTAADGFRLAEETIEWWRNHSPRGPEIVSRCVVPLAMLETHEPDWAGLASGRITFKQFVNERADWVRRQNDLQRHMMQRLMQRGVYAVVPIPYDVELRRGYVMSWDALAPATQDAYLKLAHAVSQLFPEPMVNPAEHQAGRLEDPAQVATPQAPQQMQHPQPQGGPQPQQQGFPQPQQPQPQQQGFPQPQAAPQQPQPQQQGFPQPQQQGFPQPQAAPGAVPGQDAHDEQWDADAHESPATGQIEGPSGPWGDDEDTDTNHGSRSEWVM